ncbi:prephenate dehydratase [Conexibacter sp. W3-3-2]|uniref:Prephenate dehydratase n=1 Tax=Paraconexibacter algicola TaxID=2133960 RepID=A0A2T4UJ14_9ACTN|nr:MULTISPECIES: prephenate dehydratase [Solirubrobacterales]MTD45533.1 prephenate dehydratase [Conexibacter sp. W3-3-2]PTL59219.1 prephenate dehydratase [Paraconexibacter algicola]
MRIGFLGPAGTFSHAAVHASPRTPADAELVPAGTVHATVLAVQSGTVERALVPIENALEGAVNATLDALAFDAPDVRMVGEEVLAVRHCLVAAQDVPLAAIRTVLSHPQANGQCQDFLRRELPSAAVLPAASTAEAIRLVAAGEAPDPPAAAIGTALAAELYGAVVLREGVEDDASNVTRFVWLARDGAVDDAADAPGGRWKTSVVFSGDGDGRPGWLVRCLSEFAFRGVNLTKIESRPARHRLGHYLFHLDMDGSIADPRVAEAVAALEIHGASTRVLGSYLAA